MLMVQYCSGGKWGLLLRRPFEAMSRTLPLIFLYWLVMAVFMKRLYLWASTDGRRPGEERLIKPSHLEASGALHQLQEADAESDLVLVGEPALLRHLGLLCHSVERACPQARQPRAPRHTRIGSRSLRI